MNGWLIYRQDGVQRNIWFIRHLQEECRKHGCVLRLVVADCVEQLPKEPLPDFAICRAMNADINVALHAQGVRTVNNPATAKIAGDKWLTYQLCKTLDIPVLSTDLAVQSYDTWQYPAVLKHRFGHGGSQVFWVENAQQTLQRTLGGDEYILQQPNTLLGMDTRVYAIGEKIVSAVSRHSINDFRSNYSLGGKVQAVQPTDQQIEIVKRLYTHLQFDFIGIDFLPTTQGVVLNELEDASGTRMLYACTDIDIIPQYVQHILQK